MKTKKYSLLVNNRNDLNPNDKDIWTFDDKESLDLTKITLLKSNSKKILIIWSQYLDVMIFQFKQLKMS